jgi:hypothetical protein
MKLVSTFLFALFCLNNGALGETSNAEATRALKQAMEDASNRHKQIPGNTGFSFIRTIEDANGNLQQSVYAPITEQEGDWQVLKTKGELSTNGLQWDIGFLMPEANLSLEETQLIRETADTWVFSVPSAVSLDIGNESDANQKKEQQVNNKLSESLVSELVVSKADPHFLSLHIYAVKSFKPSLLAKVKTFEIKMEYAEAWEDGPLYIKFASRTLKGKFGFLINIDEFVTTTHTEVMTKSLMNQSS